MESWVVTGSSTLAKVVVGAVFTGSSVVGRSPGGLKGERRVFTLWPSHSPTTEMFKAGEVNI